MLILFVKIDVNIRASDLSLETRSSERDGGEKMTTDGLDGVVAADTVLSEVDGGNGRLIIRGYSLDALAGTTTFEALAELLFSGFFNDVPDAEGMVGALGEARRAVFGEVPALDDRLKALAPFARSSRASPTATTSRRRCGSWRRRPCSRPRWCGHGAARRRCHPTRP
jgi:citrate synthase